MNELQSIMMAFIIIAIGYTVGRIGIKNITLGDSAVLLVALIFGHFGVVIPDIFQTCGLLFFVTSVGLTAAPEFWVNIKKGALSFMLIGFVIIVIGSLTTFILMKFYSIPLTLILGMMAGALTSTPALAAAIEVTNDAIASVGYGIAYPFGVIGVVLFVQLMPKIMRVNLESESMAQIKQNQNVKVYKNTQYLDPKGLCILSVCFVLGIFLARMQIPFIYSKHITLGISGGPLLAGLIVGRIKHIGRYSTIVPEQTLSLFRKFGLVLFLAVAGAKAGSGFLNVLCQYGISLFIIGAIITLLPMVAGYIIARCVLKLSMCDTMGSICEPVKFFL